MALVQQKRPDTTADGKLGYERGSSFQQCVDLQSFWDGTDAQEVSGGVTEVLGSWCGGLLAPHDATLPSADKKLHCPFSFAVDRRPVRHLRECVGQTLLGRNGFQLCFRVL